MIRLIALDLDGTLTNDEKIITPHTMRSLMQAQRHGVRLCLASGRPPYGMRPLAEQLQLSQYGGLLICYNGAHVEECATGHVFVEQQLDSTVLPQLRQWQEKTGLTLMTYHDSHIYTEQPDNPYVRISCRNNKMEPVKVDNFATDAPHPINKCLMVGAPEAVKQWETVLQKAFEGRMNILHSTPYFIECLPPRIDKGLALEALLPLLGMRREDLMAFGDSFNDIGMLRYAGIGVAMSNAEEEVKAFADYITSSNNDDGIAAALNHFRNLFAD